MVQNYLLKWKDARDILSEKSRLQKRMWRTFQPSLFTFVLKKDKYMRKY